MTTLVYRNPLNASKIAALIFVVTMPDTAFDLIAGTSHLCLEIVHLAFELIESGLDHLVEHLFHTEMRETQIIVFYLMLGMGISIGAFVLKKFWESFEKLLIWIPHKTQEIKYKALIFWQESTSNKFKAIAWFHVGLTAFYLITF